jgi:hypothetical protein
MRKNYNFKINQKPLSGEEITRHMDFDALLQKVEQPVVAPAETGAKIRRMIYWSGAAAAAIAMLFVFRGVFNTPKVINEKTFFAQNAFIDEPVNTAIPSFSHYTVTPNQGGVFEYESGSRLIVPSSAFMNDRGTLVEGEVNLYYREYIDYVDFFLSGIPLTYDSAGVSYILESSGIVEIFAEKDGKRVDLAAGKSIKVEMAGQVFMLAGNKAPDYNVYLLDTVAQSWVYSDVDMIQFVDEALEYNDPLYSEKKVLKDALNEIAYKESDALIAIENNVPIPFQPTKPQEKDKNRITFELDFLKDKQPEGNEFLYGGTIWQLSPNNPEIDQRAFQVVWEDAKVRKLEGQDYELELIATGNQLKLIVNPVLTSSDYELAMKQYDQELLLYRNKVKEHEKALQRDKVALHQRFEDQRRIARQQYKDQLISTGINPEEKKGIVAHKVVNNFQADELGVWICARPIIPERVKLKARFVDQNGNEFEPCVAFIADKSSNTLTKFLAQPGANVTFDASAENIMWMILRDGRIAVFRPEAFSQIAKSKGKHTFVMEIVERDVLKEFDVREVLKF